MAAFVFLLIVLASPLYAQETAPPKDAMQEALANAAKSYPDIEAKVKEYKLYIEDKEAALTSAKTKLKITDKQTALWDAFAKAVLRNNKEKSEFFAKTDGTCAVENFPGVQSIPDHSLVTTMSQMQERREFDLKQQKAFMDALVPLYNSFSPEQKRIADGMVYQMSMLM